MAFEIKPSTKEVEQLRDTTFLNHLDADSELVVSVVGIFIDADTSFAVNKTGGVCQSFATISQGK